MPTKITLGEESFEGSLKDPNVVSRIQGFLTPGMPVCIQESGTGIKSHQSQIFYSDGFFNQDTFDVQRGRRNKPIITVANTGNGSSFETFLPEGSEGLLVQEHSEVYEGASCMDRGGPSRVYTHSSKRVEQIIIGSGVTRKFSNPLKRLDFLQDAQRIEFPSDLTQGGRVSVYNFSEDTENRDPEIELIHHAGRLLLAGLPVVLPEISWTRSEVEARELIQMRLGWKYESSPICEGDYTINTLCPTTFLCYASVPIGSTREVCLLEGRGKKDLIELVGNPDFVSRYYPEIKTVTPEERAIWSSVLGSP